MSVFEKVQVALIQTRLNIACYVRREQAINDKNVESLKTAKQQIEAILDSLRRNEIMSA